MVKEDAKVDAELLLSALVNQSREHEHHLPKASRADKGKERTFFLIVFLFILRGSFNNVVI
jgi:hypothetical protein